MARATTKQEFVDLCLRKLGAPVVQTIELAPDQIDDCIDEALHYFRDYHFDGSFMTYYKHLVTQEDIDNRYITLPENIFGVVQVFPISGLTSANDGLFNIQYQIALNDLYTLIEAHEVVAPEDYSQVWGDRWLMNYTVALMKKQWGTNLKKFSGLALVGGLTFNGQQIYDEAEREVEKLMNEMINAYSTPPQDFIG